METITVKRVKARKNHICDTCGSNIFKGEEYELQTNKFEGEIYNWKNCDHCEPIRKQTFTENYYQMVTGQDFIDFISEHNIDFKRI